MAKLRGRRCRLSSIVAAARAAGQNFRKKLSEGEMTCRVLRRTVGGFRALHDVSHLSG
jgi:hypothetical protein